MGEPREGIYKVVEFGKIVLRLKEQMDARAISRNQMAKLTGVKYDIVTRYYNGTEVARVELSTLAKFCYVLKCRPNDLLEYVPPKS